MRRSDLARFCFGILYIVASIINLTFTINNPAIYREWSSSALVSFYSNFMLIVSNQQLVAVLLFVAVWEFTMGLLILSKGKQVKLGLGIAIIFHLIITPWGYWSLPNLIFAFVLVPLFRQNYTASFAQVLISKSGKHS